MKKILFVGFALALTALLIFCQESALAQGSPPGGTKVGERYPQYGAPITRRGDESVISYLIFAAFGGFIVYLAYKGQKR